MAQTLKIGILRGRHVTDAVALTPALEQACREMLVTSTYPAREAVLEYWADNTDGTLAFEATMLPWVDVVFSIADVTLFAAPNPQNAGNITRYTAFDKIKTATAALPNPPDLTGFDGFICLVAPGTNIANPNAGQPNQPATYAFDGGSSRGAFAVYPIATSFHTFMCHEFGHVLGLFDDDGLAWGAGGSTGYGDPLDIMSALSFAGTSPMFKGTPVPGWPNANAKDDMGPAPSRAVVHYWNPDAQRASFVKTIGVNDDATPPIRLYAAWAEAGAPRLIVIEPSVPQPYSIGRAYVEYRDARQWDRGIATAGAVLDRQGVVVHVAALRPTPDLGAGDTIGNRCFYRGEIVVPVEIDSDLQVSGTPWTVRVVDADVTEGWVDVKITRSSPAGFEIDVTGTDDIVAPDGPIEETRTACGDTLHHGTWLTVGHYAFRPVTWGLGGAGSQTGTPSASPTVHWTVGGVSIAPFPVVGRLHGCTCPQGTFDVDYAIDAATATLHLSSTVAGQAYQMPVEALATDSTSQASVSAQATFAPRGRFTGIPFADQIRLLQCLARIVAVFPPDLRDLRPPPDQPHPNWRDLVAHVLERSRLQAELFALERRALQQMLSLADRLRNTLR